MNSRHDSQRARRDGTQRIGHDPRRGASSPQWNREAQMQHEQFQSRHASPYASPYGGQQGGQHEGQHAGPYSSPYSRPHPSSPYAHRDAGPYEDQHGGHESSRHSGQDFGGYGDYEDELYDDDRRHAYGASEAQWSQPHERHASNDAHRGGAARGRHHDPDYAQWRHEQMQRLDEDYAAYRRERYERFAQDFDAWRAGRAQSDASSPGNGSSKAAGQKGGGSKQQS